MKSSSITEDGATAGRVSAPGKLYLLGEYAVLDGAPALLTAVDRRVRVTVTDSTSGWGLTAPDIGLVNRLALNAHGALPETISHDLRRKLALVNAVRATVDALAPPIGPYDMTVESSDFLLNGHKLGFGSSAAVAVALTSALAAQRGVSLALSALFNLAFAAHSTSQGGKGSGGDIATSVYGGHILFRQGSEPRSVSWPDDLDLFAVVTGTGSSTVDLVGRVADYAVQHPVEYRRDLDNLGSLANHTEDAVKSADGFLALADEYFHALEAMDSRAHAGIVTERHRELRALAAASGAVFKTSGAGGGDLGLVFAKLDSTDQLRSVFTEAGATVIPVSTSTDGVRVGPS